MANPWFGSDVAAREPLITLRAAVVQSPLVASKMSTALVEIPAHAQRISVHLQRIKARFIPRNTCLSRIPHHTILQYQQLKNKHNTYLSSRLRIWPILGLAVTSLRDHLLPR
jgi:hypothetical protein